MMSNGEIDRALSADDGIVPSSGFASSVMDAVRREADTPPPIPFPWKRALAGLGCSVAILAALLVWLLRVRPAVEMPAGLTRLVELSNNNPLGWIALAPVVSLLSVFVSLRAAGPAA